MLGDNISADFYVKWLGLSLEEEEELHALTMNGEFFKDYRGLCPGVDEMAEGRYARCLYSSSHFASDRDGGPESQP